MAVPTPSFYSTNPNELLPMIRQRARGTFAGAGTKLREELANAGLLGNAGAYTDSLTRLNVAEGQTVAGAETDFLTDVYKQERGAELEFQLARWMEEQRRKNALLQGLFQAVGGLGAGVGSYFGGRAAGRRTAEATGRLSNG